jgi:transposase InsO family protein
VRELHENSQQEEIYTREYRDRADLEAYIGHFLEQYYNRRRLHSALNYRWPEQFEQSLKQTSTALPSARMSFFEA